MDYGKVILVVVVLLYIISPVDFMPGPIDDVIVALLAVATQKTRNRIE